MAEKRDADLIVVPLPIGDTEAEHERVRNSNERDQRDEREGKRNRHNDGYDEAADGVRGESEIERVVDE